MTITTTTSRIAYTGDGTANPLSFPYPLQAEADLTIVETIIATGVDTTQMLTTDYTVSIAGGGATATITPVAVIPATVTWSLIRNPAATQATDFVDNDSLPAASIEDALDRGMMVNQRTLDLVTRAVKLPDGYTGSFDPTLPADITGSAVLAFNAGATAFEIGPTAAAISGAAAEAAAAAASATNAANSETAAAASATSIGLTTRGDMLKRGASANERLAIGGANTVLLTDGTDPAWGQVSLAAGVTGTLPLANGGTGASDAAGARAALGLVIGTDVQAYDVDTLKADTTDVLTAGFAATPYNFGTKTSGTFTPDEANGNMQYGVNGGAYTLAPPTNNCTIVLQFTNDASAGSITTSGFTKVSGAFTTTNGHDFVCYITKINGFSELIIRALQ